MSMAETCGITCTATRRSTAPQVGKPFLHMKRQARSEKPDSVAGAAGRRWMRWPPIMTRRCRRSIPPSCASSSHQSAFGCVLMGPRPKPLFRPDAGVQRFGLVLKQRPDDFGGTLAAAKHLAAGQVEGGVLRMIAG